MSRISSVSKPVPPISSGLSLFALLAGKAPGAALKKLAVKSSSKTASGLVSPKS